MPPATRIFANRYEVGEAVGHGGMADVYLAHDRLLEQGIERFAEGDIQGWSTNPPVPDPGAKYSAGIVLDLSEVTPHVSGPTHHAIRIVNPPSIDTVSPVM